MLELLDLVVQELQLSLVRRLGGLVLRGLRTSALVEIEPVLLRPRRRIIPQPVPLACPASRVMHGCCSRLVVAWSCAVVWAACARNASSAARLVLSCSSSTAMRPCSDSDAWCT